MYGKHFASMYQGTMVGAGADAYAVMGYVIANTVKGRVELNPKLLAFLIGASEERMAAAIAFLCKPDPGSRSKAQKGRRLIKEGEFQYLVVNHDKYRAMHNEDDRREYNKLKKRESRARLANEKAIVPRKRSRRE